MSGLGDSFPPLPPLELVGVLCIDCGRPFYCVPDSDAHKQGFCNRCWARMVLLARAENTRG